MGSFWKYFTKGMAVFGVLAVQVPEAIADGKVTVEEIVDTYAAVCMAGGWSMTISVPDEIKDTVLAVVSE